MASWLYGAGVGGGLSSGLTRTYPLAGNNTAHTTESDTQMLIRGSYTWSNLMCNVTAITGTLTMKSRIGAADGTQVISATTTGQKEDTTHSDSLSDGNLINYQGVMSGGHSDTSTFQSLSSLLDDAGSGIPILFGCTQSGLGFTSAAAYAPFVGRLNAAGNVTTTESEAQITVRAAATISKFSFNVTSLTGTQTYRTRVNGANGGQSVSATSTGRKEDTSGTDSLVAGDEICWGKDSGGTSSGIKSAQVKSSSVVGQQLFATQVGATAISGSVARYLCPGGDTAGTTTESLAQIKARVVDDFVNMQCNVTANSRSDATTVDFRAGAASPSGGPAISVASSSTGIKEDLTGTYTTATTDLINYRIVTGAGTGTITITTVGVQQGVEAVAFDAANFEHVTQFQMYARKSRVYAY